MKNELFHVLYFVITDFPENLQFQHYMAKVLKAVPEPSLGYTLVNRFTIHQQWRVNVLRDMQELKWNTLEINGILQGDELDDWIENLAVN